MLQTSKQAFLSINMRLPSSPDKAAVLASGSVSHLSLTNCLWSYRGEGNANLVLALPSERLIVRLRKCRKNETTDETATLICREAEFCRAIMQPLLGECYVHVPKVVRIPERELRLLNEQLKPLRPEHRHHKSVFGNHVAVLPDLCLLPTPIASEAPIFCVEIKPKQGWIPLPDRRLPKCTFCLNQFWKLKNKSISERSGYCPLDLFSGDIQRMKLALRALLKSPQNNFKMFCNGTLEYGEDACSWRSVLEKWFGRFECDENLMENLCILVIQALLADYGGFGVPVLRRDESWPSKMQTNCGRIPQDLLNRALDLLDEPPCFKPSSLLPPGCILSKILNVQKLDILGSEEAYRRYSTGSFTDFGYVTTLLREKDILHPLYSYLLATTAKDCSIMIAFQQIEVDEVKVGMNTAEDLSGRKYLFSIGVSDLDPKPMACIERHKKRDIEVVRACVELLERKRQN